MGFEMTVLSSLASGGNTNQVIESQHRITLKMILRTAVFFFFCALC